MPQAFAVKLRTENKCGKHLALFNTPSIWQAAEIPTYQQWVKSGDVWLFSRLCQCMLKLDPSFLKLPSCWKAMSIGLLVL